MKTTNGNQAPIFWYQGLPLQPQHLQLESRFHQVMLQRLTQLLHNEPWGVISITIREAALAEKRLVISQGEFLFPDGSLCHFPNNSHLASRPFDEVWVEAGQPFVVYLGLKQWQERDNVTEVDYDPLSSTDRRWRVDTQPTTVADCYGQGIEGQVRQLKYQLRIFWANELAQAGDYMVMPVASLERDGPRILLNEQFIPPILNVHSWPALKLLLSDINDQMVSRARQLENFKQISTNSAIDYSLLLALQALTRCACTTQLLLDTPQLSPRKTWESLVSLFAELSYLVPELSVSGEASINRWPDYDHLKIAEVFTRLMTQLKQALNSIVVGPEYTLRLQRQGAIWRVELPKRALRPKFRYWLAFCNIAESHLATGFDRLLKVAAGPQLPTLLARAISGIPLQRQSARPAGLPQLDGGLYYSLEYRSCNIEDQHDLWQQVVQSGDLALYWEAPEQAQVMLYVTRG